MADFPDLETLAWQRFPGLSEAELELLRTAPKGDFAWCGPSRKDDDAANDPSGASGWEQERCIRAEVIRWMCVNRDAKERIDPHGIRVHGAKITGSLDLSYVSVPFGIALHRCSLADPADFRAMKVVELDLAGTWTRSIDADGAEVGGTLSLCKSFRAEGQIRLVDVHIGGPLDCSGAKLHNPLQSGVSDTGVALEAARLHVEGGIFLNNGFHADGKVALMSAQIGGDLECSEASFSNPKPSGDDETATALSLDSSSIKGCVFLKSKFCADGEVRMLGAQIGGQLACVDATFKGALSAQTAVIKGTLIWQKVDASSAELDLINASAGSIVDDRASWPKAGRLRLAGFVYEHISGSDTPRDAKSRLEWLALRMHFDPQPYRQLATVLRKEGDDSGARRVLYEMEQQRRQQKSPNWLIRVWSWVLKVTAGYGYYPQRSPVCLAILAALGLALFSTGYAVGSIAPTDKDVYPPFKRDSSLPERYARFNPFIYSLENSFTLIKLGQTDLWQPDPNPQWSCAPKQSLAWLPCWIVSPKVLRVFRWAQIYLGWFFATMGVAAVTGIVRKD
jgi:hypothetical protein